MPGVINHAMKTHTHNIRLYFPDLFQNCSRNLMPLNPQYLIISNHAFSCTATRQVCHREDEAWEALEAAYYVGH